VSDPKDAAHTPGPWRAVYFQLHDIWDVDAPEEQHHAVGTMYCGSGGFTVLESLREADARLVAAAPDMLALLEELIDIEGPQPGHITWANKVKAAIAKAKGAT
jgi:hypothetical protein